MPSLAFHFILVYSFHTKPPTKVMNRYMIRFVSCLLAPILVGIDPSLASGIVSTRTSPVPMFAKDAIQSQAMQLRQPVAFRGFERAAEICQSIGDWVLGWETS